jgi:hypothetical protein
VLRYHAQALRLIGAVPKVAPQAAGLIVAIEGRLGRPLPASLCEWYSLEGACELLMQYSNGDPPVAITDLGRDTLIAGDSLIFRHENQGVCAWAVRLNGSDDPPVVVDYCTGFTECRPCANTFSDYVYSCVWDWGLVLNHATIQAQNPPISDEALSFLRRDFTAELETNGWPGEIQYRFSSPDQRILVWAAKDQADWWLAGDSDDALCRLVRSLRDVDELGRSLWSSDAAGESVLRRAGGGN